ncbi:hypothetical protein RRG08_029994 [Elysia crispata]|uniref:Uncharacterized protein n=1 Tax=Elysia crispata TaxID=231223 RepID=A0AAE1DH39_9GAST|nr:hypothetical protein RRG08_029994 [Elysia crispata]
MFLEFAEPVITCKDKGILQQIWLHPGLTARTFLRPLLANQIRLLLFLFFKTRSRNIDRGFLRLSNLAE